MSSRQRLLVSQFVRWYLTPAGLVSLAFIAAIVVLAILDLTIVAVLVTIAWLALLIPHKLASERRDWTKAVSENAPPDRVGEMEKKVARAETSINRMRSELALAPTAEEITTWQTGVEASQAQANNLLNDQIDELRATIEQLAEVIERQAQPISEQESS